MKANIPERVLFPDLPDRFVQEKRPLGTPADFDALRHVRRSILPRPAASGCHLHYDPLDQGAEGGAQLGQLLGRDILGYLSQT